MSKQVVFFGSSPLSNIVLQKLIGAKVDLIDVVTKADKPSGRHLKVSPNPVKELALKNGIKVHESIVDTQFPAGAVGLVAAYGKIIPQVALNAFDGLLYNIHPSLLPKYRGPSPLPSQILDGVTETGVTIIQLDAQMDHGPIVAQEKDLVLPDDTWITLGERLFSLGADLFISNIQHLGSSVTPQDDLDATYTKMLTRQDGFVPWEEFKPENLDKKIRAYSAWPGVWTTMPDGRRLKLISLHPAVQVQVEGKNIQPWPVEIR